MYECVHDGDDEAVEESRRDEFAARNLETTPCDKHKHGDNHRGQCETIEHDGAIAQLVGCFAILEGNGEEGDEAVADGGNEAGYCAFECGRHRRWS